MFCPKCETQYRDGFDRCADCDVPLVHSLPDNAVENAVEEEDTEELVPVLKTTDPGFLSIAKSVLDSAGIPYIVQGEAAVHLFPLGASGTRVTNRPMGAIVLVVRSHREDAEALLRLPSDAMNDEG